MYEYTQKPFLRLLTKGLNIRILANYYHHPSPPIDSAAGCVCVSVCRAHSISAC